MHFRPLLFIFLLGLSRLQCSPILVLPNTDPQYSLVNSIDFHPQRNIFCVAYTHNNKVCLYEIGQDQTVNLIQTLCNPESQLSEPQHAVFSQDKIVVANWKNQTLTLYQGQENGLFSSTPAATIPLPKSRPRYKPHGIAFSPSGHFLGVVFGAAKYFGKGVALYSIQGNDLRCTSLLKDVSRYGIPKGICFSPDGTHLLVTFTEPSRLIIFQIWDQKIDPIPRQIIEGANTQLSRPEDIKISPDGTYCAVTNSDQDSVTFYHFNKETNSISGSTSFKILSNPEAELSFPHGIAFSSDGAYLAITQFGKVQTTGEGIIIWDPSFPSSEGKINLYQINR